MAEISISIGSDQALVLFEFLNLIDDGKRSISDALPAETMALDHLLCCLEAVLAEPFAENYDELLDGARSRILPG